MRKKCKPILTISELDLSGFDTTQVIDMSGMFYGCSNLTSVDLSGIDTSQVIDMSDMFHGCYNILSLELSGFDTSKVADMSGMFASCSNLTSLDVSKFNTSRVTDMSAMFEGDYGLTSLNVSGFDTSQVTDMSSMFYNCGVSSFDVSRFDTSQVTDMSYMFSSCSILNIDISQLDTSNVTNMSNMFSYCSRLSSINMSGLDTSNVTDMSQMFLRCRALKSIDLRGLDTSSVRNMSWMFDDCDALTNIDLRGLDTSNVTDMSRMFTYCNKMSCINLSGLDMSNVRDVSNMLYGCDTLETIYAPEEIKYGTFIELPETFYDSDMNAVSDIGYLQENMVLTKNVNIANKIITEVSDAIDTSKVSRITVTDSYGKILSDVNVAFDSNTKEIDGRAQIYVDKSEFFACDNLVVSKDGYCTYSIDINEINRNTFDIQVKLYEIGEEDLVLKYVNHYDENHQITDLLSKSMTYNVKNRFDEIKIIFSAMNPDEIAEYQLWQKNKMIASTDKGIFQLTAGDFKAGGNCFIRVVGKNGKARDAYINLSFVSVEVKQNVKFEPFCIFEENNNNTIDEDIPLVGGQKLEIKFPSATIETMKSNEKMYVAINCNIDKNKINPDEYFNNLKKAFEATRNAGEYALGKRTNEIYKFIANSEQNGKFGELNLNYEVIGYAECNFGSKEAKGQIAIIAKGESPTLGFTTWVSVVPVTVSFKITGELKLASEFTYNLETGEMGVNLPLNFAIGYDVFGGVGVGDAVAAGAYGKLALEIDAEFFGEARGLRKIALKGDLGIKAYVGPLTYSEVFAEAEWILYSKKVGTYALREQLSLYSADNYEIESLDYLSKQSNWNGYPIMLDDVEVSTNFMSLLENTYLNAQPVMVKNDDVLYVAFLGADETTGEIYVQCTKMENGVWCEPVRINSQSVVEDAPKLLVDNEGNIWLAYAKTGDGYETGNLLSYAKNQSIVVGMLDKNTLALTNVREYNSDDYMHMQQLSLVDGVPTLAWVESEITDANSVLASPNNKIVLASYSDGRWSETSVVKSMESYVSDITVGDIGVAYLMDTDGDLLNISDNALVYCDWQGNEKKIAEGVTGRITYGILPGETQSTFIWNDTDKLCSMESSIDIAGITREYVINNNCIYYSTPVENGAELAVVRVNDDGTFTNPIQLTDTDRYIENISVATVYGRDVVLGMHTSAEITSESVNTSKNLVWSLVQPVNDIRIDDVSYDIDNAVSGEKLPITLTVSNAGENQVDSVNIIYNDEVVSTQEVTLKSGESKDVTFELTCPEALTSYTVKVEDIDSDLTSDYNPGDNSVSFQLGFANIEVEATLARICNQKKIVAMVTNTGIETASGKISFVNEDGNILALADISDLESGKSVFVEAQIDADVSDTTVSVVVDTKQNELYIYDNTATVYVPIEDSEYMVTYELDGGTQNDENPTNYYESDDEIVLLAPTKEGYIFEGWYSDAEFTTKVESIAADSIGDITLYAKWTEIVLKNGLQKDDNGRWYYFVDDKIDTSFTGLAKNDYGWWYVKEGKLDLTYIGLAKNEYGWWYVSEGKLDLTYTGLAKNEYGWWYVKDGKLNITYTGLAKNEYGWWYVKDGKLDLTYTGLAKNDYGWWYVSKGKLDLTYTGLAKNDYGWWYVSDGKLDRTYTGLAQNEYGVWYVVEGRPKLTYTGTVTFDGVIYNIKNGKVV